MRWALLGAIGLLALGLRIGHAHSDARRDLWGDEVQELGIVETPKTLADLFVTMRREGHAPLEYLILRAIGVGDPASLRWLPIFWGMASVALLVAIGWRCFSPTCGLLAGFWMAVSPYFIFYSTELRVYSLFTLLGLTHGAALLFFVRAPSVRRGVAWGAAAALMAYAHYYACHLILAGGLYALLRDRSRRNVVSVVAAGATFCVLFAPWLPTLVFQSGQDLQAWYKPIHDPRGIFMPLRLPLGRFGTLLLGSMILLGFVHIRHRAPPGQRTAFRALFWMGFGGALSAFLVQLVTSPFLPRYLTVQTALLLPCASLFLARMLDGERDEYRVLGRTIRVGGRPRRLAALLLVALGLFSQWTVPTSWLRRATDAGHVARFIERHEQPGDAIWFTRAFAGLAVHRAYRGALPMWTPPFAGRLAYLDWIELRKRLEKGDDTARMLRALEAHLKAGRRVWLVCEASYPWTLDGVAKQREEAPARETELNLDLHAQALGILYDSARLVVSVSSFSWDCHQRLSVYLFVPKP